MPSNLAFLATPTALYACPTWPYPEFGEVTSDTYLKSWKHFRLYLGNAGRQGWHCSAASRTFQQPVLEWHTGRLLYINRCTEKVWIMSIPDHKCLFPKKWRRKEGQRTIVYPRIFTHSEKLDWCLTRLQPVLLFTTKDSWFSLRNLQRPFEKKEKNRFDLTGNTSYKDLRPVSSQIFSFGVNEASLLPWRNGADLDPSIQ